MRFLLIILTLCGLGAVGWFAVMNGTQHRNALGADQVQALVKEQATAAISGASDADVDVRVDGRNVTLRGRVTSEDERQTVIDAARSVGLIGRLSDDLKVLTVAAPFTFSAAKSADGALSLKGHVPSRAIEDELLAQARVLAQGAPVSADLVMASGVPDGDWVQMTSAGLTALAKLNSGQLDVSDTVVFLRARFESS